MLFVPFYKCLWVPGCLSGSSPCASKQTQGHSRSFKITPSRFYCIWTKFRQSIGTKKFPKKKNDFNLVKMDGVTGLKTFAVLYARCCICAVVVDDNKSNCHFHTLVVHPSIERWPIEIRRCQTFTLAPFASLAEERRFDTEAFKHCFFAAGSSASSWERSRHPSTIAQETGVFKNFHSVNRFWKVPFLVTVFAGYVWTGKQFVMTNLCFQTKPDTCGRGLIKT